MKRPAGIRLGLKEEHPRDAVDTLAYDEQWYLEDSQERTAKTPYEVVWRLQKTSDTRIHYVEDHVITLAYLIIVGPRARQVAEVARRRLKVFTVDEILEEAGRAKSRDDWIYVVYELAAAAPAEPDPRIVQVLERALEHDDRDVRRAAMVAMAYMEWKELRPLLERVNEKDPDPGVKKMARVTLEGL